MGKKKPNRPELSRLELDLMDVVWELGDCTSAEVIEVFNTRNKGLAKTTIRTVLTNLRNKGYVEVVPSLDRGYRFKASVPRSAVARRTMKTVISKLFGGSPTQALAHLIRTEEIDDAELDEIRRMIDEAKQKRGGNQ